VIEYLAQILPGYAIQKRDGDCDEYLPQQISIVIVFSNFVG